jgi:hypothetical protein
MADDNALGVEHIDDVTFERLAIDDITGEDRARLFDHITACPDCARVWRGLIALREGAQLEGLIPPTAAHRSGWWRSPVVQLSLAATLVVIIGGVAYNRRVVDSTTLRSSDVTAVSGLSAAAGVNGMPMFSWSPVLAATGYRVGVFTEDGQVVWTRDVATPPLSWPAETPRVAGAYRWQVDALAGNAVIARSPLAGLEIER